MSESKPKTIPQAAHELLELRHRYGWSPEVDAGFAALREALETWKCGNEFAAFHPQASHIEPGYRDGWNACFRDAEALLAQRDAQIAELQAQVEALRANDARYRALREPKTSGMPLVVDPFMPDHLTYTPEGLDAAIDSAMQQKGGEE